MVQWKGNLDRDDVGEKAANLDALESFDVPNFFVLTKSEIDEFFETEDPRRIANTKIPEELKKQVKKAYKNIGMSSEVRNASGQARNLVGNQRESQRVSVRISSTENRSEYELNVGASGLEEAIRNVLSSYYRSNSETPAIIFQKMIEPEHTGAVIQNYTRRHSLVEIVEGLGHSLEEGITVPEFYLLENSSVTATRSPGKQVKVSRNPMNGQRRTRSVSKKSTTFQNSEIQDLARKAAREDFSVKFVYKRGSFYIVDAFRSEAINVEPDLEALKISEGEISGKKGEDYVLADEPRKTKKPLVAEKGGYTTTVSQQKRLQGVPAVVSLKDTESLEDNERDRVEDEHQSKSGGSFSVSEDSSSYGKSISGVTATEVRCWSDFPQLSDNPFSFQDAEEGFVDDCEEILAEDPDLVDGRQIREDAMIRCLELLGELKVLVVEETSDRLLQKVVENDVKALAVPKENLEGTSNALLREEKRFMMRNLRN